MCLKILKKCRFCQQWAWSFEKKCRNCSLAFKFFYNNMENFGEYSGNMESDS